MDFLELSLNLQLPLYQSLTKGLSSFSLGSTGILQWDSSGGQTRNLLPYSEIGFQGAASTLILQSGVQIIHDVAASNVAYVLLPDFSVSIVFLGMEFAVQASGLCGFSERSWDFPWAATGYLDPLEGSWGGN